MNYSYVMGIKDVEKLRNCGFNIERINENYGIIFTKEQEKQYEEFIIQNLEPGYWNEYLGERFVFIFKYPDNSIRKYIYNENNEQEILNLCSEFAEYKFTSIMQMLKDNDFYLENYFNENK